MNIQMYSQLSGTRLRSYKGCWKTNASIPSDATLNIIPMSEPFYAEVCRQPLDLGGCSQFITRWYYDVRSRSCRPFFYGGCFGNSNRFLTKAECDSMCATQDVCRQPVQVSRKKLYVRTTVPFLFCIRVCCASMCEWYSTRHHSCCPVTMWLNVIDQSPLRAPVLVVTCDTHVRCSNHIRDAYPPPPPGHPPHFPNTTSLHSMPSRDR
ncbi:unnamed protein product [Echinostoma caproni]|uniref:BPTI/Kunitz inhibitor domain-containing protein n=1 Tax=Echinostoma caproni TaxID=27848 RepID=A0A3P8H1J0_9TREM|nr:unnamed protein product [Echinostoma caproni]